MLKNMRGFAIEQKIKYGNAFNSKSKVMLILKD